MATLPNTEHTAQALERLPHAHRDKPQTASFLTVYLDQIQELDDVLWQLYAERNVDTAIGAQLTLIGKIVGQPRQGVSDDSLYRRYVRARITVNKSKGVLRDVYTVGELIVNDGAVSLVWEPDTVAAGVLNLRDAIVDSSVADVLIEFLRDTVAAGVRIILVSQSALDSDTFRFAALATLDGAFGAGSGTLDTLGISSAFPATGGSIILSAGLAVEETKTYTSHDGTTFTLSGTTANAHADGAGITLSDGEGKGWSDDVITTQGGKFVTAQE